MKKIPIRQLNSSQLNANSIGRFKIRRVEDIIGESNLVHHLHRHDFFFILVLKKAKGNHQIDFTDYEVQNHSIFFIRPGQVHSLELNVGSTGYLIEFDNVFYHPKDKVSSERLRKASYKSYCELETNRFEKINAILETMLTEYQNREEGFQSIIISSLEIFFIEFVRQSTSPKTITKPTNTYTQERFEEFLELMDKNILVNKQITHYASLMNLSPYQLNEITKTSIGKSVSELINEHILLEAKRYLLTTSNQIKEIADILGYEDTSYFIRFFKKHISLSPEAFRLNYK